MSATDELSPWWRRHPERVRWELANFADRGIPAGIEEGGGGGPLIRCVLALSDDREVPLTVRFPFDYPILPPSINLEPGLLGRPHEVGGHLCLFDDPRNQWNPTRGVAELIDDRVRALLEGVLVAGELAAELEEQIPEVDFLRYPTGSEQVAFVPDPFWEELPAGQGSGTIALLGDGRRRLLYFAEGFGFASDDLAERVGCERGAGLGRWVALAGEPKGCVSLADVFELARSAFPGLLEPVSIGSIGPRPPQWLAINFLGPGVRAGEQKRRWGFLELSDADTVPPQVVSGWEAQALTPGERRLRTPELGGLEAAKIVLVGAGSLGSKVGVELAKASCDALVVIDDDTYEAGNAVRHELAPIEAGAGKADALASALKRLNPFCEVGVIPARIGEGLPPAKLVETIDGADLVIETTGERAVTRLCERYCRIAGVRLLSASLTRGSRGGDMVLLDSEHCFDCFLLAQQAVEIPSPPIGDTKAPVVPIGCAHPAFSGSGFDSSELASAVARMAVRATARTTYPALDHDWAVVDFLGAERWKQGRLEVNPNCGHTR